MNYWLICTTPNMVGASDLHLIKPQNLPEEVREEMIQNNRKKWKELSKLTQDSILWAEINAINLDDEDYDPKLHNITKILKFYLTKDL